jgi:hypothetical protein
MISVRILLMSVCLLSIAMVIHIPFLLVALGMKDQAQDPCGGTAEMKICMEVEQAADPEMQEEVEEVEQKEQEVFNRNEYYSSLKWQLPS